MKVCRFRTALNDVWVGGLTRIPESVDGDGRRLSEEQRVLSGSTSLYLASRFHAGGLSSCRPEPAES